MSLGLFIPLLSLYYPCGEIHCRQPPPGGAQHVLDVGGGNWSTWRKPIQAREECANSTQKGLFQPWTFLLRGDSATSCMPPYTLYTCTGPTGILTTSSENKHDIFLNCGDVCVETGKLQIIFY